ncbi:MULTISPECIES: BON domain-containing protein [unclassified Leptolyngbya]|uniref:BON domain-containing protein n=1 Tax=unclassified Leptolyngbya TaxID=2650499 RepID=UPI00168984DA|nr:MULTISPECIES: BON domain-containing protein [unclassified Leptolyngbya]MBD1913545.1 BON domain-containing protein [Leptolyngbya sp. FACHB-8]MBD2155884.1 BON domain-containing protein [Leptolyngbya sp. FACHB-16]
MKTLTTLLLSSALLLGGVACSNTAQTAADAPDDTTQVGQVPQGEDSQTVQEDGESAVRRRQLNSDIRAREQRNNAGGGDLERADGDLESEVRSKLEANLPASQLTTEAKDGVVTISGTVPTQPQLERIDSLAREIKGVTDVKVNAVVAPAQPAQ